MKIVIRAGGLGTRLWPMSRKNNPKQFQKIIGDKSMLLNTYERLVPKLVGIDSVFVSINQGLLEEARKELVDLNGNNFIIETDTRNTGPAMCLEVCYLEKFCDSKEIIASLPSDDYISNVEAFQSLLRASEKFVLANSDFILTPAVKPDYPDTGYSYMKAGKNLQAIGEEAIYEVIDVVEKPNSDYCQELLDSGIHYCHTGMYIWQLGYISKLFQELQPGMYQVCQKIVALMTNNQPNWQEIKDLYSQLEKISIESAITDKAPKLAMSVSNRLGWSDLGKWHVIKRLLTEHKSDNLIKGEVIVQNSKNCLIYNNNHKKIIVINDVEDLAIIDTGDVLFVSSLKDSAEVKKIVEHLAESGKNEYL